MNHFQGIRILLFASATGLARTRWVMKNHNPLPKAGSHSGSLA